MKFSKKYEFSIMTDLPPSKFGRNMIKRMFYQPIRGHYAVMRSILKGFKTLDIKFNYNPIFYSNIAATVYVPANLYTLKKMIELKKDGKIKRLIAGPNLVVLPTDSQLMLAEEIDCHIVPSKWVMDVYRNIDPQLKNKMYVWAAGVNTKYWCPGQEQRTYILIYKKHIEEKIFKPYLNFINNKFYNVSILEYGGYNKEEYKNILQKSKLAIFFSATESQGIAMIEAWSCNVPTLIWHLTETQFTKFSSQVSSSPYLTNFTGDRFSSVNELDDLIKNYLKSGILNPREWVLKNMSDIVCGMKLLKILRGTAIKDN